MSNHELEVWQQALQLVPAQWIPEFARLVQEGEASDEFTAFFNEHKDCQRAFEMVLRADLDVSDLVKIASSEIASDRRTA